jgi:N4-gp56 family major capsid protein
VTEHIRAVSLTEYLLRSALTDCLADATTVLGQFYAKNRDALVRDTILGSAGSLLYSQAGGTTTTRAGLAATSTFNVDLIRDAVETLATNKAPKFGGDAYVCFVHSHQAKYLRKDSAWISVQYYANPANLLTGEIGRIEDVRFIETTQIPYIAKGAGSQAIYADGEDTGATATGNANTAVYRAIIVGDWAVGLAEALPVELRDNGVEDYGRKHSVGYYGIWGAGAIETGHMAILETA